MLWGPEYWFALTPRMRAAWGTGIVLLMLFSGWWWGIHPLMKDIRLLEVEHRAQHQTRLMRWKTLLPLKPPESLDPERDDESAVFSPLDFQSTGRDLVRWRALSNGGEMVLASRWQYVPATFVQLAESNMQAAAFSLEVKEETLHFTLQLESNEDG